MTLTFQRMRFVAYMAMTAIFVVLMILISMQTGRWLPLLIGVGFTAGAWFTYHWNPRGYVHRLKGDLKSTPRSSIIGILLGLLTGWIITHYLDSVLPW